MSTIKPHQTSLRQHSWLDNLLIEADRALRTVAMSNHPVTRPSPGTQVEESEITREQQKHAAGLMRVNHSGEVCAQALYHGQAMTAQLPKVREEMEQAAAEEIDHLQWCETRLNELNSRPSIFNPLWYGLSFGIGAGAGLISDKISLGFVAATEEQVAQHLRSHLTALPEHDNKSRVIVKQMLEDEEKHGHAALQAGGTDFPKPVKRVMTLVSKVMTGLSYRI